MGLSVSEKGRTKVFFENFVKETFVEKIIGDIVDTGELDLSIIGIDGNILYSPPFVKSFSKDLLNDFSLFIRREILKKVSGSGKVRFFLPDESRFGFILYPIFSQFQSEVLGYVLLGPYRDISGDEDRLTVKNSYRFIEGIDSEKILSIGEFDDRDVSYLPTVESLGKLLSLLYDEKAKTALEFKRLESIHKISGIMNKSVDLKQVLQDIVAESADMFQAESASILMYDKENERFYTLVATGMMLGGIIPPRMTLDTVSMRVVTGSEGCIVKKEIMNAQGASSFPRPVMSVPLRVRGEVFGVYNIIGGADCVDYNGEDLQMLETLAAIVANSIKNNDLFCEIKEKVRQLSALFDLGTTIVVTLERREVLEKVLQNAIQLLHAKDGSLMLLDEEKGELEIEVAHGLSDDVINHTRIPVGEGIAGKVALEGKPRRLKKGKRVIDSRSDMCSEEVPSALSVPMTFREKIIGVLNVKEKITGENFTRSDLELLTMLASQAAIAIENADLHQNLQDLFVNSIKALANAIEARDPYTRGHSERVTEYSVKIAEYMGLDMELVKKIRYAALLHDIGKINIKEEILNKPGQLTEEEFKIILEHPAMGAKIMQPVKEFREILPFMYHHHERYGSGGYPDGVQGEQIPLPARILAVADSFDAMTTDRPYRKALTIEAAIQELIDNSGTQFDPKVVREFLKINDREPHWIVDLIETSKQIEI